MVGLAGLVFLAFRNGLNAGFVSDDFQWLNRAVAGQLTWTHAFNVTRHFNALPLAQLQFNYEFRMFGYHPSRYHLFDLAGQVLAALLLFSLARQLNFSRLEAAAAAALGAVATASAQAVYWPAADFHLWSSVAALAALGLYVQSRRQNRKLLFVASVFLSFISVLIKAEGVAVLFGVLAYELFWGQGRPRTWKDVRDAAVRVIPFVVTSSILVAWELTATDPLRSESLLGANTLGRAFDYFRMAILPDNPGVLVDQLGGPRSHHLIGWLAAVGAVFVAGWFLIALVALLQRGFAAAGYALFWFGSLLAVLPITEGAQSRYVYLATLVVILAAIQGSTVVIQRLKRASIRREQITTVVAMLFAVVLLVEITGTQHRAWDTRIAGQESVALRTAVLHSYPSLFPNTRIYLIHSPLDAGSARLVFADPRLRLPEASWPSIFYADSVKAIPGNLPGTVLAFERLSSGRYLDRTAAISQS